MHKILLAVVCLSLFSCAKKDQTPQFAQPAIADSSAVQTAVKTFQTESGWGYDIEVGGKPYIHQPTIPSLPGNSGFKTQADAETVAALVCHKIQNNIMPPSVTPQELDSLKIK